LYLLGTHFTVWKWSASFWQNNQYFESNVMAGITYSAPILPILIKIYYSCFLYCFLVFLNLRFHKIGIVFCLFWWKYSSYPFIIGKISLFELVDRKKQIEGNKFLDSPDGMASFYAVFGMKIEWTAGRLMK
jgi:hypothetical protein